jgi:hypothetical protein
MEGNMRRPEALYEIPDEWGYGKGVCWFAIRSLERVLKELRDGGRKNINIKQCRVWWQVSGDVYQEWRSKERRRFSYNRSLDAWEPVEEGV